MGVTNLDSLTLGGDLVVAGSQTITGNVTFAGDVTLGDDATDTLTINGASVQLADDQPILDSNGAEVLAFSAAGTAVNELQIGNAATGNPVSLSATGDDANVGIRLAPKGTGGISMISTDAGATGVQLSPVHLSASPAVSDEIFIVDAQGNDDAAGLVDYAGMAATITDASTGAHFGTWLFSAADGTGSTSDVLTLSHNGSGGIVSCGDGSAAGTFQSEGSQQVILATGDDSGSVNVDTSGSFNVPGGMLTITTVSKTPNNDDGGGSQINPGEVQVEVGAVTNDANDWILLPTLSGVQNGHTITILNNAGTNFEMRTTPTSGELINGVDADGTNELLMTDTEIVVITKISDTAGWSAYSRPAAGGVTAAAVTPD